MCSSTIATLPSDRNAACSGTMAAQRSEACRQRSSAMMRLRTASRTSSGMTLSANSVSVGTCSAECTMPDAPRPMTPVTRRSHSATSNAPCGA
jgi:hypothetical protein